ncbi:MAG: SDR family oxidoreductase [Alphaproteobacteria bacterium]|nr:SDR family oxidoreductase [Alphaproteobacteria bacterium]MBO6627101.1 SDR family oxidoreductase [Alphaproteobacteria bacterium]MDF1626407.1 SDR family NAD(P)-dependent oxidoreductase [Parvibaculaceae bacterium]
MRLNKRVAIVTGAASGIGRATAELFAAEGARVLAVDLSPFTLEANGIETLAQDVAMPDAGIRIVKAALDAFGQLDIIMNNAGVAFGAPLETFPDDYWDKTMAVNVTAQFKLVRAAVPHLKESKAGRVINVASIMAESSNYGLAAYSASKAAVAGLTRNLALELGGYGITANYILPGAILTGMAPDIGEGKANEVWAKKAALKRIGQPLDIARGALFLASDDGGFVTGHGLNVDGGMLMRV